MRIKCETKAQKVCSTGLLVVTVLVSKSEHTLLQKEGKERKELNTLFAISSGQKSTRSRIRKVVLGFAAQLWGIQSMYCIMTTPLTTVLAFTHCFGFKTAFQTEATDDFHHWWNQQTHAIFFKCKRVTGLNGKLSFSLWPPTAGQSQRCCSLCDHSNCSVLIAPAVNAAARSNTCSSTSSATLQPSDKASALARLNFNNPHASMLASEATKLQTVCPVHLPALHPPDSDQLPASSRVSRRRDTDTLPAGLWHDPCALAKEGLLGAWRSCRLWPSTGTC